jgi:hypothetical protein
MYNNNLFKAPSPNVGNCNSKGTWASINDEMYCQSCFKNAGESSGDYFYCEGGGCMSKYDLNSVCPTGALVAKNIEQCSSPCNQQGYPTVGGGCSDSFDCNYKNGEVCQKKIISINSGHEERGYCVQGGVPQPVQPTQTTGNNIMDLMTNCSQDMSNINSVKKCLLSVTNLSCDDINTLVLYIKQNYPSNDNYRAIKQTIMQIFTNQNEQLITDILISINESVNKVNCLIDSLNKNFDLQTPKINTDNVKKQIVQNIYSNSSEKLQNDLLSNFSCSKNYKMISMVIMAVIIFLLLVFIYLYMRK